MMVFKNFRLESVVGAVESGIHEEPLPQRP